MNERPVEEQVGKLTATVDQLQSELDQLNRAVTLLLVSVAALVLVVSLERQARRARA